MNEKLFESRLLSEKYFEIKHSSGLRIYVCPKDVCTTFGILCVGFGGSVTHYSKDGHDFVLPEGCAHFLEHKLFDNPDGNNADDVFSSLGAYCNAYTSNEKTAYLFSATENVDLCLEHLVYFVTTPYFTDKTVQKEMGIIAEEIRGCIDDPYDRCYLGCLDGMYYENPVKNEICGSERSISKITPEILYKCCEDFYVPSNMTLCVCGNVTVEQVVAAVDKQLKTKPAPKPQVKEFCEPRGVKRAYTESAMPIGKPLFYIGIKDNVTLADPVERCRRSEAVSILLHMLFSQSGSFYLEMLERGLISPGFDFGYSCNSTTAFVMLSGESDEPKKLLEEIKSHVEKCKREGLMEADLEREKRCIYASYVADFDSSEDIAFSLSSYAFEKMDMFLFPDVVQSIELGTVTELLNTLFDDGAYTLSVISKQE